MEVSKKNLSVSLFFVDRLPSPDREYKTKRISDSNYADLTERIFYQTEVRENGSISQADKNNDDQLLDEEEDEELALYLERSERRANFIERNKELAASGDILTKIERERLDAILACDDDDNVDETIATNDSEIRLAQINTELENKFSSTALVPVEIEETCRSEKRLKEIDSRLSFIQSQANLRTGSSQLLAIKDIEADASEEQESTCNDVSAISKMLTEFQLELERVSLASTCDVMSEQEEEPISEEKIQGFELRHLIKHKHIFRTSGIFSCRAEPVLTFSSSFIFYFCTIYFCR